MSIIYLIVLAITATVIINTLIMSVYERTREIGILAAIGMKGSRIMAMFFAESSLLAVGGIVMGLVNRRTCWSITMPPNSAFTSAISE